MKTTFRGLVELEFRSIVATLTSSRYMSALPRFVSLGATQATSLPVKRNVAQAPLVVAYFKPPPYALLEASVIQVPL